MRNFTFQLRRGTAAQWTATNPILRSGEPGVELDTNKFKIGDGINNWASLPYYINDALIAIMIEEAVIEGVPGPPGDSAYQVAVDNGFVGTESQWLASLVGPAGTNGTNGTDGADGADGTNGTNGTNGADGTDGVDGQDGDPGPPGADGDSAYEVAVNNGFVGTEAEWLASLVGADGADGADGTNGTNGTNGSDGAPGDSAYQVAVDNGFVGTEAEWLASLVGADGADGADGAQGIQGIQGIQGTAGTNGTNGTNGVDGVAGGVTPISGKYSNAPIGMVGSNLTLTANTEFAVPMAIAESGTILGFGFELVTVGTSGAVVRGGIRIGNNAKRPGTSSLLQEAPSTVATDSGTGAKEFTFTTPQAVTKGDVVWLTLTGQTASCVVRAVGSSNPYVYDSAVATGTQTGSALTQTGVSGALPANYTVAASNNGPRVSVKWQ